MKKILLTVALVIAATISHGQNADTIDLSKNPTYTSDWVHDSISHDSMRIILSTQQLLKFSWKIEGVTREALVYIPADTTPMPIMFAFHGHGGTMQGFARKG